LCFDSLDDRDLFLDWITAITGEVCASTSIGGDEEVLVLKFNDNLGGDQHDAP